MEPLKDLTKGLEILVPFLGRHGFTLDNYENGKGSGGHFTVATFKSGRKSFFIGYRFSIGELGYQFDNYQVGHTFYLDHLGLADKGQFPGFCKLVTGLLTKKCKLFSGRYISIRRQIACIQTHFT